jgi:ribosomal protein S1
MGDKLKVLVIKVDTENGRIILNTKNLEQERGDFLTLDRKEFNDRAEVQAAAWRERSLELK